MSDAPFEFSYVGESGKLSLARTPQLGEALDAYVNEHYGADFMVGGMLVFDETKTLVGLRVESWGIYDDSVEEQGDNETNGPGAWDAFVEYAKPLGEHVFTFIRRPATYGHGAEEGQMDVLLNGTTFELARRDNLVYQGHVVTDGTAHAVYRPHRHDHDHGHGGLDALLGVLDGKTRAEIGRQSLARLLATDPNVPPEVVKAMELAISLNEQEAKKADPEELATLLHGIEAMRQRVGEIDADPSVLVDPPTDDTPPPTNTRADVPPAFYN